MQEQQFTIQQQENEQQEINQLEEEYRRKLVLMDSQLFEQKQQVRNSKPMTWQ